MANEKRVRANYVLGTLAAALDNGGAAATLPASGLKVNLDGETLTGANGSAVTSWSGYGAVNMALVTDATPGLTNAVQVNNGGTSIQFGNLMATATAGDLFLVYRQTASNSMNTLWDFGADTQSQHYAYSGAIYEEFGTTSRSAGFTPGVTLTDWHIYNVTSAAGSYVIRQGTSSLTVVSNRASNTVGFPSNMLLGGNAQGQIAQLVIYDRVLSDAERTTVVNFLQRHWTATPTTVPTAALSSPGLAKLPVIDSTSHAAIALTDATAGEFEIIHVISHESSSTVATVQRAREGTTARAWPIGASWVHGPTALDMPTLPGIGAEIRAVKTATGVAGQALPASTATTLTLGETKRNDGMTIAGDNAITVAVDGWYHVAWRIRTTNYLSNAVATFSVGAAIGSAVGAIAVATNDLVGARNQNPPSAEAEFSGSGVRYLSAGQKVWLYLNPGSAANSVAAEFEEARARLTVVRVG